MKTRKSVFSKTQRSGGCPFHLTLGVENYLSVQFYNDTSVPVSKNQSASRVDQRPFLVGRIVGNGLEDCEILLEELVGS